MTEAEEIRDPSELKKRIDDLNALTAVFHEGRNRERRRDPSRRHNTDYRNEF